MDYFINCFIHGFTKIGRRLEMTVDNENVIVVKVRGSSMYLQSLDFWLGRFSIPWQEERILLEVGLLKQYRAGWNSLKNGVEEGSSWRNGTCLTTSEYWTVFITIYFIADWETSMSEGLSRSTPQKLNCGDNYWHLMSDTHITTAF